MLLRIKVIANRLFLLMLFIGAFSYAQSSIASANHQPIKIAVSIKPLKWLVEELLGEQGSVEVILEDDQNFHVKELNVEQQRQVSGADLVFLIHSNFEIFLSQNVNQDGKSKKFIELGKTQNLRLLAMRESGAMPHVIHLTKESVKQDQHQHAIDWHIWLSPENTILMLQTINHILSHTYPAQADLYARNFEIARDKMMKLVEQTTAQVKPVLKVPFLVLHDGYQYFEEQYGLQARGAVFKNDESLLSVKYLGAIKKKINDQNIQLMFKEQQYPLRKIKPLVNDLDIVELDSLGQGKGKSAKNYFEFMQLFSHDVVRGLKLAQSKNNK